MEQRGPKLGLELAHPRRDVRLHGVEFFRGAAHGAEPRDRFEHFQVGDVHCRALLSAAHC